jgi:hypothetical protein
MYNDTYWMQEIFSVSNGNRGNKKTVLYNWVLIDPRT